MNVLRQEHVPTMVQFRLDKEIVVDELEERQLIGVNLGDSEASQLCPSSV